VSFLPYLPPKPTRISLKRILEHLAIPLIFMEKGTLRGKNKRYSFKVTARHQFSVFEINIMFYIMILSADH